MICSITGMTKTYLKLEDVYTTGILAQELKIKRVSRILKHTNKSIYTYIILSSRNKLSTMIAIFRWTFQSLQIRRYSNIYS